VQLINTAVILLIVNGNLNSMGVTDPTITIGGLIFVGDHDDFNSNWYVTVGASLVLTMIINLATPTYSPLGNCVTRGLKRVKDRSKSCVCCGQDKHFTKKLNQSEYEALWDGGEFELPARYGAIQMVYWVTMMYGTGLPVLYVLAFFYFFMCYWVDKWAITKLYNKPAQSDEKVAFSVTGRLIFGVLLHMLFATWKYSNSKIFRSANMMVFIAQSTGLNSEYLNTVTQLLECGVAGSGGGGFSYALTRIVLTAPHMFIVTLLIILYLIINRIIMPIFGTIILGALPCFALCCKHYEEDTQLTAQEAIDQGKMQGAKSYDITSNRAYAAMFGLDEEEQVDDESENEVAKVHDYKLPENDEDEDEKGVVAVDTNDISLRTIEMVENPILKKDIEDEDNVVV
jgi:hypothetical protein